MKTIVATSVALVTASLFAVAFADEVTSGLQVGDKAGAYNVKDCTGPSTGKSLCYRWKYGARPVVNVFTRTLSDDLASLVKQVDKKVAENEDKQMAGFVVLLTDDPDAAESDLKAFAEKHGIKHVPLTLFDGVAGPPNYKVAKDAEVTVMLWRQTTVAANHAFAEGKLNKEAIAEIIQDTDKILE